MEVEKLDVKFDNGEKAEWEVIRSPNAVMIIPIDKENNVYLTKEWRAAWGKYVVQFPVGTAKGKTEEELVQQARNELREEIGLDAGKIEKISEMMLASRENATIHVYLAQDLFESKKDADKHEYIEIIKIPFREAYDMFTKGREISTAHHLAGLLLAKEKLGIT